MIIQHDETISELMEALLANDGFEVERVPHGPDLLQTIRQRRPDVVVLDLLFKDDECWHLLDDLRSADDTQGIPIVVTATLQRLLDEAITSYTVRQVVPMPFDAEDFIQRVRAAVEAKPRMPIPRRPSPPESTLTLAADLVTRQTRGIVTRWVQRVRLDEDFRQRALKLVELINGVPFLIPALASVLRYGVQEAEAEREELWEQVREHVRIRKSQSVSLPAMLREYSYLRDEIWLAIERAGGGRLAMTTAFEDVFELARRLNYTLDHVLVLVAETYQELGAA